MWLHFAISYPNGKNRTLRLNTPKFEEQMEALDYFVSYGCKLRSAFLIDENGKRTNLPVEAFDGVPNCVHIKNLQLEYQLLLSSENV